MAWNITTPVQMGGIAATVEIVHFTVNIEGVECVYRSLDAGGNVIPGSTKQFNSTSVDTSAVEALLFAEMAAGAMIPAGNVV